jgi:hypothetical protein
VFRQNGAGEWLNLAKRNGLKAAGPFQAERESTDPAE